MRGELFENPKPGRCVTKIFEDISGGCTLVKSELRYGASGYMSEGILISLDKPGLGHLVKTCKAWSDFSTSATGVKVYKNHEFKAGDIIIDTIKSAMARNITAIDSTPVSYDLFSIASGFGASGNTGTILIEASASGVSGMDSSFKYSPDAIGISEYPVDLSFENRGFALLIRGTVDESEMPYPIDDTLKALFPLIRFI